MKHPESDRNPRQEPISWLFNRFVGHPAVFRQKSASLHPPAVKAIRHRTVDGEDLDQILLRLDKARCPSQIFDAIPVITYKFFELQRQHAGQLRAHQQAKKNGLYTPGIDAIKAEQHSTHALSPIWDELETLMDRVTDHHMPRITIKTSRATVGDLYHAMKFYYHADLDGLKPMNKVELRNIYNQLFEQTFRDRSWRVYSDKVAYNVVEGEWLRKMLFVVLHLGRSEPPHHRKLLAQTALSFKNKLPGAKKDGKNALPGPLDGDVSLSIRRRLTALGVFDVQTTPTPNRHSRIPRGYSKKQT